MTRDFTVEGWGTQDFNQPTHYFRKTIDDGRIVYSQQYRDPNWIARYRAPYIRSLTVSVKSWASDLLSNTLSSIDHKKLPSLGLVLLVRQLSENDDGPKETVEMAAALVQEHLASTNVDPNAKYVLIDHETGKAMASATSNSMEIRGLESDAALN